MLLLIYNPVSGRNSGGLDEIKSYLSSSEHEFDVLKTRDETTIKSYLSKHTDCYKTIIVAGGDGTISQTIDAMVSYGIIADMCIYPRGSTNEFCLALGITKESMLRFTKGEHEFLTIDVGTYNGQHSFIYSMSFGYFTHITYKTPQSLKNVFGHIAYWLYGFFSFYFLKIRTYDMRVTCDDEVYDGQFVFGGVSNSHSLGTVIQLPEATFNDGLFELTLVKKPRKYREFRQILKSLVLRQYDNDSFIRSSGSVITFESRRDHSWNKDGEFAGKLNKLAIVVKRKSLKVVR